MRLNNLQLYVQTFVRGEIMNKSHTSEELKQKAEDFYFKKYTRTLNVGEEERQKSITEAYIAGAKENGIQWHKVADGDLPEDTSVKRVFASNNEYYRLYYSHGRWVYCDKGGFTFFGDVIAWCEEPLFKE